MPQKISKNLVKGDFVDEEDFSDKKTIKICSTITLGLRHVVHPILKGRVASSRNSSAPPPRQALDIAHDPAATPVKILLPHPQTCGTWDLHQKRCNTPTAVSATYSSPVTDLQTSQCADLLGVTVILHREGCAAHRNSEFPLPEKLPIVTLAV